MVSFEKMLYNTWMDLVDNLLVSCDVEDREFYQLYIKRGRADNIIRHGPSQLELLVYNRHMLEQTERRNITGAKFKGSVIAYNTIMSLLNAYNKQDRVTRNIKFIPLLPMKRMKIFIPKNRKGKGTHLCADCTRNNRSIGFAARECANCRLIDSFRHIYL